MREKQFSNLYLPIAFREGSRNITDESQRSRSYQVNSEGRSPYRLGHGDVVGKVK